MTVNPFGEGTVACYVQHVLYTCYSVFFWLCWVFTDAHGPVVVVHRLLIAGASLGVEHGLYDAWNAAVVAQALKCWVSSCGTQA